MYVGGGWGDTWIVTPDRSFWMFSLTSRHHEQDRLGELQRVSKWQTPVILAAAYVALVSFSCISKSFACPTFPVSERFIISLLHSIGYVIWWNEYLKAMQVIRRRWTKLTIWYSCSWVISAADAYFTTFASVCFLLAIPSCCACRARSRSLIFFSIALSDTHTHTYDARRETYGCLSFVDLDMQMNQTYVVRPTEHLSLCVHNKHQPDEHRLPMCGYHL